MFIFYYLTETKNIILKIKKNINFPNLILSILFIFYFLVTFLQGEILISKFHLLDDEYTWWSITTINSLIINYKFFLISLMSLIFFLSLYKKKYMRKYMLSLYLKKINFYDLFLLILIPIVCVFFLILKGQNIEFFNIEKLKIFFLSFKLSNLFYYFLIPAAWYLIFFFQSFKIRYIFLTTIVTYTFFSIFINNAIVLPGIYILEIALLYFILYELVNSREKYLSYILIGSLVITVLFNFTNYNYKSIFQYRTGTKLIFKVEDLKYLKKNKYLCPADIIKINNHNLYGSALSGILAKPYYAEFSFKDRYSNWHIISKRWAAKPRDESKNLCNEK